MAIDAYQKGDSYKLYLASVIKTGRGRPGKERSESFEVSILVHRSSGTFEQRADSESTLIADNAIPA